MSENALEQITEVVLNNQLYIIPLYSVNSKGACSCGKEDCSSPGKHPLFRYNWKIIASNKPERINEWFSSYKKMNFGLATGRLSKITEKYLVVIDVDSPEHPFIKTLPETFSYRTGSGGWHFWFWSKYPIKNSVSLLADKVDVRGTDGYVVIPPSNHRKGKYDQINNIPICDLPQNILNILLSDKPKPVTEKVKTRQKPIKSIASIWVSDPVPKIRDMMNTQLVPEGIRNVVMHRLLSSDRARGAQRQDLEVNARNYLKSFTKAHEISGELDTIIDSVMKYPAYNNSHEKVNELYISWLKKNKNISVDKKDIDNLTTEDINFFSLLKPADIKQHRVTLNQILDYRINWLKLQGLKHISNYKPQLLAKKLVSLGFQRHRTAKGNWWNVDLSQIISK